MIELYLSELLLSYSKIREQFSYNDLRKFYYSSAWKKPKVYEWHTIERAIRKFAQIGLIDRVNGRKRALFKINKEKLEEFHNKLLSYIRC